MRVKHVFFTVVLMAMMAVSVSAQPGGAGGSTRPEPSSGGNAGGPGMNGAAYSPSVPELQAPAGGQGGAGGGGRGGGGGRTRPTPPPDGGRGVIGPDVKGLGGMQGGGFSLPADLTARFEGRGGAGNIDLSGFFAFDPTSFAALGLTPPFESEHAQVAYDQRWAAYDSALTAATDAYYSAVTATTDEALQTYEQAVALTTAAVDDYAVQAASMTAYCAAYPWDCYSYAYDSVSDSYTDVSAVSDIPQGEVLVSPPAADSLQVSVPTPSATAYQALVSFANDQLGLTVTPLYAGAPTTDFSTVMGYLPAEIQAYVFAVVEMADAGYWGLWHGGAGAVMVGTCSCTLETDALPLELTSASAGVYALRVAASTPTTPDAALALLTAVYPKLKGLSFAQVTNVQTGLAFTATAASIGYDPVTHVPQSVAKVVYVGVVDVDGQALTYALVGIGEAYATLLGQ